MNQYAIKWFFKSLTNWNILTELEYQSGFIVGGSNLNNIRQTNDSVSGRLRKKSETTLSQESKRNLTNGLTLNQDRMLGQS